MLAVFGLIAGDGLLKAVVVFLGVAADVFHLLPHWADVMDLLLVIVKMLCVKRVFLFTDALLLL